MNSLASPFSPAAKSHDEPCWRKDAARIVEELFPVTPKDAWDMLLDLRNLLLTGDDWNRTLDLFLACRLRLEADHYLPFYRLRRLLSASLRIEAMSRSQEPKKVGKLDELLRRNYRSFADLRRTVQRDLFEHTQDSFDPRQFEVRIVHTVGAP